MNTPESAKDLACWCGHSQRQHHWTGACVECALTAWNSRESPVNAHHSFALQSPSGYRVSRHSLSRN
ncbi:MAG: hypothetical protein ACE5Q6_21015 [Dehalococcoidia bacterium]